MVTVHILGLTEEGQERYRNVKLPTGIDQAYLLQSLHPCGFDSTQSMCCLEGSVCAQQDYLMEMKEMARKSAQSEATGRGRGKGLVFRHTLFLRSLPSIPSPVDPSENSCVTGMKAKAESTTRNTPALMSQIFCPYDSATLILHTNTFLCPGQITTVVNLIFLILVFLKLFLTGFPYFYTPFLSFAPSSSATNAQRTPWSTME